LKSTHTYMQRNSCTCGWWGRDYNSLFIVVVVIVMHYTFKMQVSAASSSVTTTE